MVEEWKPIPGYEGLYDASNMGRIRSHPGRKLYYRNGYTDCELEPRILFPYKSNKRGDLFVKLTKCGKPKTYVLARLIASAWHGMPKDEMTVNHINGNIFDNRAKNLEWCTRAENVKHAYRTGLRKNVVPTTLIAPDGTEHKFYCLAEANRFLGKSRNNIRSRIERGENFCRSVDGTTYTFILGDGS